MNYKEMTNRELVELYVLADTQEKIKEIGKVLENRTMWSHWNILCRE